MPRNIDPDQLQFNLEIERIARQLWKEARSRSKSGTSISRSEGLPEGDLLDGAVDNSGETSERDTMANEERTLREFAVPDVTQQPLCIGNPAQNTNFELKSGLIHLLPTFRGLENEDPHKHLKEFHVVCSGMR